MILAESIGVPSLDEIINKDKKGLLQGRFDLPNPIYHDKSCPGLSAHGLMAFACSPAHYQAYLNRDHISSAAQDVGTLVHMRILEPDHFIETVMMKIDGRTAAGKEQKKKCLENGQIAVKSDVFGKILMMANAVTTHPICKNLLIGSMKEKSFFSYEPDLKFSMKARPDAFRMEDLLITEVKTTGVGLSNATIEAMIYRNRWHWQSSFHRRVIAHSLGIRPYEIKVAHVFVEDDEPYGVRVFALNEASLEAAEKDYYHLFPLYKNCLLSGKWPSYDEVIIPAAVPYYAFN